MAQHFLVGEIWREENKQNLQIRHVAASTTRVNQGVEPWVLQRPLASPWDGWEGIFGIEGRADLATIPRMKISVSRSSSGKVKLIVGDVLEELNTTESLG